MKASLNLDKIIPTPLSHKWLYATIIMFLQPGIDICITVCLLHLKELLILCIALVRSIVLYIFYVRIYLFSALEIHQTI